MQESSRPDPLRRRVTLRFMCGKAAVRVVLRIALMLAGIGLALFGLYMQASLCDATTCGDRPGWGTSLALVGVGLVLVVVGCIPWRRRRG
jgi:hypothetical protein